MKSKIIITLIFATLFAGCEFLDYSEKSFYDDPEDIFANFNRTSIEKLHRMFYANPETTGRFVAIYDPSV